MNHKIFVIFLSLLFSWSYSQKISIETLLKDDISIRAIDIYNSKVWYAGTNSKFGFVSLKDGSNQQIKLSEDKLQFRTLAQDRNYFYTINIESPAKFFRIDKKNLQYKVVYVDGDSKAFYDALHFSNGMFYTFSDPENDLKMKFRAFNTLRERFLTRNYNSVQLKEGEAAFAASNTNIASSRDYIWIATCGKSSRIIRMEVATGRFEAFDTPFVQGSSSQGIYSIDFFKNKFGVAVGGDYTKQNENINNIATTTDAGKTWQIQASRQNSGYKTCVKIRPGSRGKEMIAVGDQNIEYSKDWGKTWKKISDEKNLYTCEWITKNSLVFAGKGRIIKMNLKGL